MALNLFALGKKNSPPPPNLTSDISHLSSTPTPRPKQSVQSNQSVQDIIAPSAIEVDFSHIKIYDVYIRTLFVTGYPRYVSANWLSPLINFNGRWGDDVLNRLVGLDR